MLELISTLGDPIKRILGTILCLELLATKSAAQ